MIEVNNITVVTKSQTALLKNISFCLGQGEVLGITGESGAGKTTLIKTIMGMLDKSCQISTGHIAIEKALVNSLSGAKMRELCGIVVGFIPQNPMTAFDSRIKIGKQIIETFCVKLKISKKQAKELAIEKLEQVNLKDANRIMESFPLQLSGGMLQRVALAIILGLRPKYILADEPTAALDEENRNLLLELLKKELKDAGILMISHDVFVLKTFCEKVLVMENGTITEKGTMKSLLHLPQREWTKKFSKANEGRDRSEWAWRAL